MDTLSSQPVTIIAGPCSIDTRNVADIYRIAEMENPRTQKRAIAGTRVVGIKSRTSLDSTGKGMGIDYPTYIQNNTLLMQGKTYHDFEVPPSVTMAEEICKKTGLMIASEIVSPMVQMPSYINRIPKGKLLPWNPAVNQLGWQTYEMATYAREYGWHIGIKNGKWVGDHVEKANTASYASKTTMEKAWEGLATYARDVNGKIVLIQRGVDVPDKGSYRNMPIHEIAKRAKKTTNALLFFDPSHAYGPKMRQDIVPAVIDALKMMINDETYLYDGILIETGTSQTDTDQHISIDELQDIIDDISTFRTLASPDDNNSLWNVL